MIEEEKKVGEYLENVQFSYIKRKVYLLQIFYWMSFCSISGFATVYLVSKGIPNSQIGLIIATGSLVSVFAQFGTGILIDKYAALTLKRALLLFFGLSGIISFFVLTSSKSPLKISLLYCLLVVLLYNAQPLVTSLIYGYVNKGANLSFSFSRGIGSMMYASFSFFMGLWLDRHSTVAIPLMTCFLMAVLVFIMLRLPETEESENSAIEAKEVTTLAALHRHYPSFFLLIVGVTLIFSFHTIINVYIPQIVGHVGGGTKEVGFAIALAGFCEIPTMLGFKRLEERFNVVRLLRTSAIFFFIKAVLYLVAPNFWVLQTAQLLQALSFALITPAYAHYINEMMAPRDRVKGQTFMMAGVTLGNVIGSLSGGFFLDQGGVGPLLVFGTIQCFIGMLIVLVSLRKTYQHNEQD